MDRFKFRVFCKSRGDYVEKMLDLTIYYDGRLVEYDGLEQDMNNHIIERCTGLKDKNGNLIYEGDIIHEVDKEADIDDVSQIVWNQGTCHFMKLDLPETGLDRHCILCEDDSLYIEIIGNIHNIKDKK